MRERVIRRQQMADQRVITLEAATWCRLSPRAYFKGPSDGRQRGCNRGHPGGHKRHQSDADAPLGIGSGAHRETGGRPDRGRAHADQRRKHLFGLVEYSVGRVALRVAVHGCGSTGQDDNDAQHHREPKTEADAGQISCARRVGGGRASVAEAKGSMPGASGSEGRESERWPGRASDARGARGPPRLGLSRNPRPRSDSPKKGHRGLSRNPRPRRTRLKRARDSCGICCGNIGCGLSVGAHHRAKSFCTHPSSLDDSLCSLSPAPSGRTWQLIS